MGFALHRWARGSLSASLKNKRHQIKGVNKFLGGATLKTAMPDNATCALGFPRYVKSFRITRPSVAWNGLVHGEP